MKTGVAAIFGTANGRARNLGYDDKVLGDDRIFWTCKDSACWAAFGDDARMKKLFDKIQRDLVNPQPVGALCMWPFMKDRFWKPVRTQRRDMGGDRFVDCVAWSRFDKDAAWRFFYPPRWRRGRGLSGHLVWNLVGARFL